MTPTAVLPQTVYRRAKEPRDLPSGLRLKALEWALYFAVTGKHTAAELGRQLRAASTESAAAFARLLALGLIAEQELDAADYVRALAAAGDSEEKSLREFLMGAVEPAPLASAPLASAPAAVPTPVPPPTPWPRPVAVPPAFGFKPLPPPDAETKENRPMPPSRRLSLRALMNLIERRAASREAGLLDVYRVFVRVDTLLLKRNGIESLRFTEDRLISDPELEQALVKSLKKTLGLDCPEAVWVEVA
jgi:hypothetical protein